MVTEHTKLLRPKLAALLKSDPTIFHEDDDDNNNNYSSSKSSSPSSTSPRYNYNSAISPSGDTSPYLLLSPSNHPYSPYMKSPWIIPSPISYKLTNNGLIGSISREGGHVYSLAAGGDLLYTGSDSKNIRVWKNCKEFSGFKSNSGLVKAIVLHGNKIFTGHQDGKIRVWRVSARNPAVYKRVGTLPTLKDSVTSSVNPKNYVKVRRHRNVLRIKHFDAVSCLSLNEETRLLYSGSWDKTMKVWRISDFKCLESINAHDDAINSVVSGFDSFVLTGSADGSVKMWRRELVGSGTKHFLVQTLLKQENAVTALAVNQESAVIYCGSSDGLVNFWEREKYLSHSGVLRGHKSAVLCLASAGNLVFSGSADKTICVWRREAGGVHICLSVLTGHGGPVKCLAVEEDHENDSDEGDRDQRWIVYSGSLDRSVKIWRVAEQPLELRDYESPRVSYSSSSYSPTKIDEIREYRKQKRFEI